MDLLLLTFSYRTLNIYSWLEIEVKKEFFRSIVKHIIKKTTY